MNTRIERLKAHLKKRKAVYISAGVGLIVGVTTVVLLTRKGKLTPSKINEMVEQFLTNHTQFTNEDLTAYLIIPKGEHYFQTTSEAMKTMEVGKIYNNVPMTGPTFYGPALLLRTEEHIVASFAL